ncbi:MAG: hypothetical protein R2719_14935 [Micropruina sp.]
MDALFQPPDLGLDDLAVIEEIGQIRARLASVLRAPKRGKGGLRRTSRARAIQGSNSIEGYTVSDQDAVRRRTSTALADERTWARSSGIGACSPTVLSVASEPGFTIDEHDPLDALHAPGARTREVAGQVSHRSDLRSR